MRVAVAAIFAILSATGLAGCGSTGGDVNDELTWQDAKAEAQQTENEIVALIPAENVASTNQRPQGTLLSCDGSRHQWSGRTTVALAPGVDAETVTRAIADHFRDGKAFTVKEDRANGQPLLVQLIADDNEENYIVAVSVKPGEVEVSSASKCFTLPEDVYPGGKF